jgi:ClpP class serine protease
MDPLSLLWIFLILVSLQPALQRQVLLAQRRRALNAISREREATVVTLIHRQEQMSLLGFPIMRYIDIDDAEGVLRAINETPEGRPIEIILHTPGGLVIAARQIAAALADHDGRVTAVVPHYAMSGGTLIALAADEILLDRHATVGPVDPQIGQYPAASLLEVARSPGDHDDQTLILADVGRKAIYQVEGFTKRLLERHMPPERARDVAHLMASGVWTHDHPLLVSDLEIMGLPTRIGVPQPERDLLPLYPQPHGRAPAVEYAPGPPRPTVPSRREAPGGAQGR